MKKRFLIFTILLFSIKTNPVFAQDTPPEPCTLCPPVGENIPIDDYIPLLLVAGAFIGGTYFYKNKSKLTQ